MIHRVVAQKYLTPSEPTYWRWDQDAESAEFTDGKLLAFRVQLAETLDALKDDGLPPIGAVLLALCATMHGRASQSATLGSDALGDVCGQHHAKGKFLPPGLLERVNEKLGRLGETIKQLNDRALTRTALEMVFEGCPVEVNPASAATIVQMLKAGPPPDMVQGAPARDAFDRLLLDLRTLDAGIEGITPDAVRRRHHTGVEQPPEPAEAIEQDLPLHLAAKALMEQLEADEEHRAFGKAARQLHAALRLPRRLGSPDDVPLGGLSDITNRGQLDRLLVSELAQDDLTLAIRVANNEALYLRREETHTRLPTRRHLLIDVGLSQWGLPRVISAAAGLALHAVGDEQTQLSCWCATHDGVEPVSIHHRAGLDELMSRLELNLAPTRAIQALGERLQDDPRAELIVVLASDAASDPATVQMLRSWRGPSTHLVAVHRTGRVVFSAVSPQGLRVIGKTLIDVEGLSGESTSKRRTLTDPARSADLPAAIRQAVLPLRVPHPLKAGAYWYSAGDEGCTYAITSDRRLTRWDSPRLGPVEMCDHVPPGTVLWHAVDSDAWIRALIGRLGKKPEVSAISIGQDPGEVSIRPIALQLQIAHGPLLGIACHRGTILAAGHRIIVAIDAETGQVLTHEGVADNRRIVEMAGRCVMMSDGVWYALSYDGTQIRSDCTLDRQWLNPDERVIAAFNARGIDGLVNITDQARVLLPVEDGYRGFDAFSWPATVKKADWSADGRVVRIEASNTHKPTQMFSLLDLSPGNVSIRSKGAHAISDHHLMSTYTCNPRSVRIHYQQVGVGRDDAGAATLYLRTRKVWLRLAVQHNRLAVVAVGKSAPAGEIVGLKPIRSPTDARYKLSEAVFGGRGRVVLDSRGMLHLQPTDPALTEATLIIEGDAVSGWCSDGRVFGEDYYVQSPAGETRKKLKSPEAYQAILRPILEHLHEAGPAHHPEAAPRA